MNKKIIFLSILSALILGNKTNASSSNELPNASPSSSSGLPGLYRMGINLDKYLGHDSKQLLENCNSLARRFIKDDKLNRFEKEIKLIKLYQKANRDLTSATENTEKKILRYLISIIRYNYSYFSPTNPNFGIKFYNEFYSYFSPNGPNFGIEFYSEFLQAKEQLKDSVKNILNLRACSKDTKEYESKEMIEYLLNRQELNAFRYSATHRGMRIHLAHSEGHDDSVENLDQKILEIALARFCDLIQR